MYIEKVLDLWVQLIKNGGKNKSVAFIILFRVNVFCTRFPPSLEVPLTHAAETGSPCGCGRVGGDISFESLWGPAVEFSSPTLHTLRHLRHVEASRTSRTSFKRAFPRCGGDRDSGPHPPSTNYTAPCPDMKSSQTKCADGKGRVY